MSAGPRCVMPCDPPTLNQPRWLGPSFRRATASSVTRGAPTISDADATTTTTAGGSFATPPPRIPRDTASAFSSTALSLGSTVPGGSRHRFGASAVCSAFGSAPSDQNCARRSAPRDTSRSTTAQPRAPRPTMATPPPSEDVAAEDSAAATGPRARTRRRSVRGLPARSASAVPMANLEDPTGETRGCADPGSARPRAWPRPVTARADAETTEAMLSRRGGAEMSAADERRSWTSCKFKTAPNRRRRDNE